ncbi:hypothetical protein LTR17_012915 [Elasticomyces elasticus]|nr:hypothetical protein LTR17_012915 [Elasticomyces elasticus]
MAPNEKPEAKVMKEIFDGVILPTMIATALARDLAVKGKKFEKVRKADLLMAKAKRSAEEMGLGEL